MSYQIYYYSSAVGDLQLHALKSGGEYLWASSPDFGDNETEKSNSIKNIILRINPTINAILIIIIADLNISFHPNSLIRTEKVATQGK